MDKEISTLESNHTWIMTSLPASKPYRIKLNPYGTVKRYKAWLVGEVPLWFEASFKTMVCKIVSYYS